VLPALPAGAVSTDYESETATISQGAVESNHAGYSGTGFVNFDNVVGSYVEYTVNAAQAGTQTLTFRYANGTTANGGPNADKLTAGGPADAEAPTPPKNLAVKDIKARSATFSWEAATDNVGVVRYEIMRGGNILKTVDGNTLSATVDNLTPNTAYDISVGAFDAAGNPSQQSNVVQFTTPPSGDTTPPTVPGNLRSTSATANSISLA
jgi:hypothetical protein